jgi:hypothetical protein
MSLPALVTWGEPMPRTPTSRRLCAFGRAGVTLLTALALVAVGACGGDDDDEVAGSDQTGPETTTTTPTTAELTPEAEAKAAYLEFVAVVERLSTESPDPDDPDLLRLAVDPVLSSVRDGMTTQRAENQIWERGDRTSHEVGTVEPTQSGMRLHDCVVENDVLIDQDDGTIVEAIPLTTRALEVTLVPTADSWAVSEVATTQRHDGETSCET